MAPDVPDVNDPELPDLATLAGWASDLGFEKVSVTDVDLSAHEPYVREFLARGLHGDMGYLARNLDKRLQPALLEPETIRVISARMNYLAPDTQPLDILADSSKAYISRYALGRDYHKVLRRRLAQLARRIDASLPGHHYRAFTDSAPVLEKALAANAGLGWMGKHTLILDEAAGSWFFLGEIFTNAPLALTQTPQRDACGKCNACITVCPTQAITGPKQLDARRCISYLTIEHKGSIPIELRRAMGNRVYGCDDCQLYCPWNRQAPTTTEPDFQPRHGLEQADLLTLFKLSEAEFLALTEGSAMRRVGYEQWQRNMAVGLGNGAPDPAVRSTLRARLPEASPLVAEHIEWALGELTKRRDAASTQA